MEQNEFENLKYKICKANALEQLELAELLLEELKINNEYYNDIDYIIERSYDCVDDLESKISIFMKKIESYKLKKINSKFKSLNKKQQKRIIDDLFIIMNKLGNSNRKQLNDICLIEGHCFSIWKKDFYVTEELRRDNKGNKVFFEVEVPYWVRVCEVCGYEQKRESIPEEMVEPKDEEHKKRIKEKFNKK